MSTEPSILTRDERKHLMDAWKTSEDVAMHFNGLLIGFRLKAIGVISVSTVFSLVYRTDSENNALINSDKIFYLFFGLAIIWGLICVIDIFYYYPLLAGAIDEVIRLERRLGNVRLSHSIARRVLDEVQSEDKLELILSYDAKPTTKFPPEPILWFYGVPFAILIVLGLYFLCHPP